MENSNYNNSHDDEDNSFGSMDDFDATLAFSSTLPTPGDRADDYGGGTATDAPVDPGLATSSELQTQPSQHHETKQHAQQKSLDTDTHDYISRTDPFVSFESLIGGGDENDAGQRHQLHGQLHEQHEPQQQQQQQLHRHQQLHSRQSSQYQQELLNGHSFTNGLHLNEMNNDSQQYQQQTKPLRGTHDGKTPQSSLEAAERQQDLYHAPASTIRNSHNHNHGHHDDGIEFAGALSTDERRSKILQDALENDDVIELFDNDDDNDNNNEVFDDAHGKARAGSSSDVTAKVSGVKRPHPDGEVTNITDPARTRTTIAPASSDFSLENGALTPVKNTSDHPLFGPLQVGPANPLNRVVWHKPVWEELIPSQQTRLRVDHERRQEELERNSAKYYELSLLNVSEFTISGCPTGFLGRPCRVQGLRKLIKQCSRGHGKAVFDVDKEGASDENPDGGKWRIPLGAYENFFHSLKNRPKTHVVGIPQYQLSVASLGKARQDKGFPSVKKLINAGVPPGLACSLADFQRGGVDFVIEKGGRALIADDMGLGKTIQGIASMAAFHQDWPLLVLTPSSARYHWEAEFIQWLGEDGMINQPDKLEEKLRMALQAEDDDEVAFVPNDAFKLLHKHEINVLRSGKSTVLHPRTRVVICSYGLAPSLVANGTLQPGMFKSVIVDESHYLKSMKTKRTTSLMPILRGSIRCVLLSGTPALARPSELWPQLLALKGSNGEWWTDENDFQEKYVTRSSPARRAELHCMLTSTLMIRRMKSDMLKNLPKKQREKALVNVTDNVDRREFHRCMELLRQGKGVMANIAKDHSAFAGMGAPVVVDNHSVEFLDLKAEYDQRLQDKVRAMEQASESIQQNDESYDKENWRLKQKTKIKAELDIWYNQRLHEINQNAQIREEGGEEQISRKAVLNRMYGMTARAKVPLVVKMLRRWLADPTKGKLCIFAHHIYVLDEIVKQAGLSNADGSTTQFIRIDGSTNPQERQNQIQCFQDPRNDKIRVAVLGITAAGVAVTLTASSTVWFAELFWTPALMVQAEDRVHRIGQTSAVKILYIVANGTLDLLLWSLLEKKFRALGEFVEGQEKMKIVVQKTYESKERLEKEYFITDNTDDDDDGDDDGDDFDRKVASIADTENYEDGEALVNFESQLGKEIDELEQEEMDLLKSAEEDEGEFMDGRDGFDSSNHDSTAKKTGTSEDRAIDLDDEGTSIEPTPALSSGAVATTFDHRSPEAFTGCQYYAQTYSNPQLRYGLELFPWQGNVMVDVNRHGLHARPEPGDIVVAVNGSTVPHPISHLSTLTTFMRSEIAKGPVTLWMVDGGKDWKQRFLQIRDEFHAKKERESQLQQQFQQDRLRFQSQQNHLQAPDRSSNAIIELLDDSDDEQ